MKIGLEIMENKFMKAVKLINLQICLAKVLIRIIA